MTSTAKSKPELILHVGFAKTGSSSIQQTFSQMQFEDLAYAEWGGSGVKNANHSGPFRRGFMEGDPKNFRKKDNHKVMNRSVAGKPDARDQLKTFLKTCTKPRILISAEAMMAGRFGSGLVRFAAFVRPYFSRIRVFGYVRPDADLSASQFQQRLKRGTSDVFPGVAGSHNGVALIDKVFGQDEVTFVKYDRETLYKNDVVLDFANRLGVPVRPDQVVVANESVSLEAVSVLFCHFKFGKHRWDQKRAAIVHRKLVDRLVPFGKTRFEYSQDLVDRLEQQQAGETKLVEDRLQVDMRAKPRTGGIGSEQGILDFAATCETELLILAAAMPGTEDKLQSIDPGIGVQQRVALIVDAMKDSIRDASAGQTLRRKTSKGRR